jgi:hypothetical protein
LNARTLSRVIHIFLLPYYNRNTHENLHVERDNRRIFQNTNNSYFLNALNDIFPPNVNLFGMVWESTIIPFWQILQYCGSYMFVHCSEKEAKSSSHHKILNWITHINQRTKQLWVWLMYIQWTASATVLELRSILLTVRRPNTWADSSTRSKQVGSDPSSMTS